MLKPYSAQDTKHQPLAESATQVLPPKNIDYPQHTQSLHKINQPNKIYL
jgi:hypothetical protein